jgi:short-subunit dehydrogenase
MCWHVRAGSTSTPNFVATNPAKQRGPLMAPEPVVREALNALGKRPVLIPGTTNRLANALMTRLLPRAMAVRIMGDNTRAMYPE